MNWQNKEGDIKKILESQEFAFNPKDWEMAEKMLLQRKKRRRKKLMLIILPLPVVLLLTLGIYTALRPGRDNNFAVVDTPGKTIEINTGKKAEKNSAGKTAAENQSQGETEATTPVSPDAGKNSINDEETVFNSKNIEKNINSNTGRNEGITREEDNPAIVTGREDEIKENNIPSVTEEKEGADSKEVPAITHPGEIPPAASLSDTAETPSATAETEQDQEEKQVKKEKDITLPVVKNKIGITAGGNYSRLLSVQHGKFALLPYLAVNYGCVFNSKWQLGAGLAYSVMNGGLQKQYSVKRHAFGETRTELTIQTTRLHYLEVPVTARYNFNDKLFFTSGINAGYLLGIKGRVNENNLGVFAKTPGYSRQAADYMSGLKSWDLQLQLGAEIRYKKQFYLGGLINSGLLDIGDNGYYSNSAFERNLRLQLYVRYELWNF